MKSPRFGGGVFLLAECGAELLRHSVFASAAERIAFFKTEVDQIFEGAVKVAAVIIGDAVILIRAYYTATIR